MLVSSADSDRARLARPKAVPVDASRELRIDEIDCLFSGLACRFKATLPITSLGRESPFVLFNISASLTARSVVLALQ